MGINQGLGIDGAGDILLAALKREFGHVVAQDITSALIHLAAGGKLLKELFAHARVLGPLPTE